MRATDLELSRPNDPSTGRLFGTYRGLVLHNADPWKLGRLKLHIPAVQGPSTPDIDTLRWAVPCYPAGGSDGAGAVVVPQVGATVWVVFECGDVDHPIWIGTWHGAPGGQEETPARVYCSLRAGTSTSTPDTDTIYANGLLGLHGESAEQVLQARASDSVLELDGKEHRVLLLARSGSNQVYLAADADEPALVLVVVQGGSVVSKLVLTGTEAALYGQGGAAVVSAGQTAVVGSTVALNPPGGHPVDTSGADQAYLGEGI